MNRKLCMLLPLALMAAAPARARDGAFYVEGMLGGVQMKDVRFRINQVRNANRLDLHTGQFDVGFAGGYDFGHVRVEGEFAYKHSRIHHYFLNVPTIVNDLGPAPATFYNDATGRVHDSTALVDVLAETGGNRRLGVYAGMGAGIGRVVARSFRVSGPDPFLDSGDEGFAWQFVAGVRLPVTHHIEFGVRYHYTTVANIHLVSRQAHDDYHGTFRTLGLLGTLGWNF